MRIRHLRYFLIVAEEQNFARAAAKVHIEASPLSRAMKELESDLGVHLFRRNKGRIQLTWAGEVFRKEARRILTFIEDARVRVRAAAQGYQEQLRIGLTDRLAQPQLARLLALCREEEPLTTIRITEMTVNEMVDALNHGQIDAGFTVHATPGDGLHTQRVWLDNPVIAIPKHHPLLALDTVPLNEAAQYPLILYHPELCSGGHDVVHRWFQDAALQPPSNTDYVSGHEAMMMLVAAGYGIGIGLESQITLYSHPVVIIRPTTDNITNAATFIAIPDKPPSDELIRFITRAQHIGGLEKM